MSISIIIGGSRIPVALYRTDIFDCGSQPYVLAMCMVLASSGYYNYAVAIKQAKTRVGFCYLWLTCMYMKIT